MRFDRSCVEYTVLLVYWSPGKSLQIGEWSGQQLGAGEWELDSAKEKPSKGRQAAVHGYRGQVRSVLYPSLTTYQCACVARFILETTDAAHGDDDYSYQQRPQFV